MRISEKIKTRLKKAGKRYFANDNISDFIEDGERDLLISELTEVISDLLNSTIIDTVNDPHSKRTAYRLAKMYVEQSERFNPPNSDIIPVADPFGIGLSMNNKETKNLRDFYVYIYKNPLTFVPMYVGKGKKERYSAHTKSAATKKEKEKNSRFISTIRKIKRETGLDPIISIIADDLLEEEAFNIEKHTITELGRADLGTGPLLNLQVGGYGGAINPEIVKASHNTPEYLANHSKLIKEYWANISDEDRERRKQSSRNSYTPELRKNRGDTQKKIWNSLSDEEKQARTEKSKQAHKNRSAETKEYVAMKSREYGKTKGTFVTRNPKSIPFCTPDGNFISMSAAYRHYGEKLGIDKKSVIKMMLADPKNFYIKEKD